jgi:hypothetical protein
MLPGLLIAATGTDIFLNGSIFIPNVYGRGKKAGFGCVKQLTVIELFDKQTKNPRRSAGV